MGECFGLFSPLFLCLAFRVCLFVCLFDMLVFPGRIMMCEPELGWLYPAVVYVNWCFDYRIKIGCFNKLVIGFVFASHILVLLVWFLSPKWTVIDDDFEVLFMFKPINAFHFVSPFTCGTFYLDCF